MYRKSSLCCHSPNCVEVAEAPEGVFVRDTNGTVLSFSAAAWGQALADWK